MTLKKLYNSRSLYVWLPIILLLKVFVLCFFYNQTCIYSPESLNGLVVISNDYNELIEPTNQLMTNGVYSLKDINNPYAGRLPGYTFPYIIYRFIFSENIALQLLIITQFLFSAISIFYLSLISEKITKRSLLFIISIIIFSFFPFFIKEELFTMATSFSVSAFIMHLYFLEKFITNRLKRTLLISGLFLTWVVLLRPFTLLYFFPTLILITYLYRKKLTKALNYIIIFIIPFLIFESFWITRNYINTQKIIPLQDAYVPGQDYGYTDGCDINCIAKYSVVEIRKLISAWGGNSIWYKPGTEMHWFLKYEGTDFKDYPFIQNNIFSDGFTKDSLINLKKDLKRSFNHNLSIEERSKIDETIVSKAEIYRSIYAKNHPLDYYVFSHLKRIKNFLYVNPTQDWPGPSFMESSNSYKIYKLFSISLYFLSVFSLVVYGLAFIYKKDKFTLICFTYAITLIFIFSFLVELPSVLYFSTGLICGWICLLYIISKSTIPYLKKVN